MLKALQHHVIVYTEYTKERKLGDTTLVMPDKARGLRGEHLARWDYQTQTGMVISAGKDVKSLKPGDMVEYKRYMGVKIPNNYGLERVQEASVLGVWKDE